MPSSRNGSHDTQLARNARVRQSFGSSSGIAAKSRSRVETATAHLMLFRAHMMMLDYGTCRSLQAARAAHDAAVAEVRRRASDAVLLEADDAWTNAMAVAEALRAPPATEEATTETRV